MTGPFCCRQAGFQISNSVRCFWRSWPARSPHLAALWDYVESRLTRYTSCKYWWLEAAYSGLYSRDPEESATTCFGILSVTIAGVYKMTPFLSTKCHIKTVKINMNSHEHGMFLPVLIKSSASPKIQIFFKLHLFPVDPVFNSYDLYSEGAQF